MRAFCLFLLLPGLLQAQIVLGRLYYTTRAGRAVSLRVVEAGPGRMTLAPERGDAELLRAYVLAQSGALGRLPPGARMVADPVPSAWRGGSQGACLLQTSDALFWRYAPDQALAVQFKQGGQVWHLLSADLPPGRIFLSK